MVVGTKSEARRAKTTPTAPTNGVVHTPLDRPKTVERERHHTTPVVSGRRDRNGVAGRSGRGRAYSTDADRLLTLVARTGTLCFDVETRGLHPHSRPDAAVGAIIARSGGENFIFREYPDWWDEALADADTRKIGSNLAFDLMWNIHRSKLPIVRNVCDIMIESQITHRYRTYDGPGKAFPTLQSQAALRNSSMWEPNDLASIIMQTLSKNLKKGNKDAEDRIYHEDVWTDGKIPQFTFDEKTGKIRQKMTKHGIAPRIHKGVDWLGEWTPSMVEYMLEDIEYLEPAHEELTRKIYKEGQERVAWIENNSVFAIAWMKYKGITPDIPAWHKHLDFMREQAHHLLTHHLRKIFPSVTSFKSHPQMKQAMSEYVGTQLPNIDKYTVRALAPLYPGAHVYQDWKTLATRIQNWGPEFLNKYVCKICGRFHPDWRQIGAETMRCSCANPNLQQIPRDKSFRALFIAPEDHWLISLDYSAIEVVTAAVFANCFTLMEACRTGDAHAATARMVLDLTLEAWTALSDEQRSNFRQNAKITNFGLLFGGGVGGLIDQARNLFNVHLTEEQAREMIAKYYGAFRELRYSRNWAYKAMEGDGPVEVRNLVGMRRWLEGMNRKPTSWLNTIIQSSAGHGIKSSFRYVMEYGLLPYLVMQIHDELLLEVPGKNKTDVIKYGKLAHRAMLKGMKEVLGDHAPVIVDWGEKTIGKVWL